MADPAAKQNVRGAPARRTGMGRVLGADLPARIAAAVALMAGALASAWAGGYWFSAFWLIAALVVHWEWQRLIGGPDQRLRVLCGSAALVVAAQLAIDGAAFWAAAALVIGAAGAALASGLLQRPHAERPREEAEAHGAMHLVSHVIHRLA